MQMDKQELPRVTGRVCTLTVAVNTTALYLSKLKLHLKRVAGRKLRKGAYFALYLLNLPHVYLLYISKTIFELRPFATKSLYELRLS